MTKGEIISMVKNQIRIVNADYKMPNRFIWSIVDKHTKWLIKRDSEKMRLMKNASIFQTLKCVEVTEAPAIDDCCGVSSKCTVFRTKEKLPKLYEDGQGVVIKSVYSIDGSIEFQPINVQQYIRKLETPLSKYDKGNYYYYNNGYLYFPNSKIVMVMVKGYFQDDIVNICDEPDAIERCQTKLDEVLSMPPYLEGELMKFVIADLMPTRQIRTDESINKEEKDI